MPATYPTATDLTRYFNGAGLVDLSPAPTFNFMDLAQATLSARSNYEGRIGRTLLAVSATRTYDAPDYPRTLLPLKGDMAGSPSAVTVNSVAMVLNTDYYMLPTNADIENPPRPFTRIDFAVNPTCPRRGIVVTGPWGYATTISDGAWNAILARAAYLCYPQLAQAITRGLSVWRDDVVTEQYGPSPLGYLRDQWEKQYEGGVERFLLTTAYFG